MTNTCHYENMRPDDLLEERRYDECIAECDMSLQIDPGCSKWYFLKGVALICRDKEQGKTDALWYIENAIKLEPSNNEYQRMRAMVTGEPIPEVSNDVTEMPKVDSEK